jgi:two-component system, OmpR family, phosphate regulon response regulator OmpR
VIKHDIHSAAKILIVDDDPKLQQLLSRYLSEEGYVTAVAGNGQEMDNWLQDHHPDLVIMDLMLPGEDGLSLAQRLRNSKNIPIIMLSARGEEVDRIIGLEVGADDYLPKPFNPRELLARIRAVLRRNTQTAQAENSSPEKLLSFGEFELDIERKLLFQSNKEVALTTGEMTLLIALAQHPDRVLSRDQLMDMIAGHNREPFDRSIDVRITRLRHKIELDPSSPQFIRTVWGQGYRFTPKGNKTEKKSNS